MNESQKNKFISILTQLLEEAELVSKSQFASHYVGRPMYADLKLFHKWWGKVKSLGYQLGVAAKPWEQLFAMKPDNSLGTVKAIWGQLEAIKHEIENDYLQTVTQLVKAETFTDMIEQGEHLFKNGYHLAAGVIGRVILEDHLRTTCSLMDCFPQKNKPTINDYNQALYGIQHYNKIKMKQIEALAAIGNDAAHNSPELEQTDVEKLLKDLPNILDTTGV